MTRSARRVGVLLFLVALLCLALPAEADRETAEFFADRGTKALRDKDWAEAEELYRRALEEDEMLLPARVGLAEALLGARKRDLAVKELRRVCAESSSTEDLPKSWKSSVKKARRLLEKADKTGAEFRKLLGGHVSALVKFATKWKTKDSTMALQAVRQALALDPECERARELLPILAGSASTPGDPLFNGKDVTGWIGLDPPYWRVENGLIVARIVDAAYKARTERRYSGNYDVLFEARFVEKTGRVISFVLQGGYTNDAEKTVVGFLKDAVVVLDYRGTKEFDEIFGRLPQNMDPPLDIGSWNVFELRFRDDRIHALVNGKEVCSLRRREERAEGFVGLVAQCCTCEIKRVELRQR